MNAQHEPSVPPEPGSAHHTLSIPAEVDTSQRLDAWLVSTLPFLSRARIQALMRSGAVTIENHPVKPSAHLHPGATVIVSIPPPAPATPQPEERVLDIVYEDSDILVLNKPADLVVHPAPGHATGTLVNALLHHCDDLAGVGGVERPGIVHRLDKDTTGLMVVAKHDAAMSGLAHAFQTGGVIKEYLAIVHGAPVRPSGTISTQIGRDPRNRMRMAVVTKNGKSATTHYQVQERFKDTALILARIETGRTHQIRVHLAHLGTPIVGDSVYGSRRRDRALPIVVQRPMLHATHLSFKHPVSGVALDFRRPPHDDMSALLAALQTANPA